MNKFDEIYYEKLFNNARDILLVISEEKGEIIKANKAAVNTYGYSYNELIGMKIYKLRRGENQTLVKQQMKGAVGEGILFETVHYKKDGSYLMVEVSSINIGGEDSRILLSSIREITERKESEVKIRFYEERLRLLYESMSEGCALSEIITDDKNNPIDYRYININDSFARIIGLKSEDNV